MGLFARLWADDFGGIVTTEYLMVMGVATAGAVSGGVMVRDTVTAGFARMGQTIVLAVPDPEAVRRQLAPPVAAAAPVTAAAPVAYTFTPPAP